MSYTVQLHRTLAPHTSLKLCLITSSWPLTPLLLTVFSSVKWSSSGRVALCFYSHALMLALHMTLTVECAACCFLFKWLIKFSAALSQWTPGFLQEQRLWFFYFFFSKECPTLLSYQTFGNPFCCNIFLISYMIFWAAWDKSSLASSSAVPQCARLKSNKTTFMRNHLILRDFLCESSSPHYTQGAEWFMFRDP